MADDQLTTDLRFSIVPEWVIDLDIPDRAFRLYALLARYADSDGTGAFPSRRRLAERLRCSTDSIDRGLRDLVAAGAIRREHRFAEGRQTSNLYVVQRIPGRGEGRTGAAPGGRKAAAGEGRKAAAPCTENPVDREPQDREDTASLVPSPPAETPRHRRPPEEVWSPEVLEITRRIAQRVRANGYPIPGPMSTEADRWYDAIEKLLRIGPPGGKGEADLVPAAADVHEVITWTFDVSDFWPANIRSAVRFRAQYPTLRAQMKRSGTPRQTPGAVLAPQYEAAAQAIRDRQGTR